MLDVGGRFSGGGDEGRGPVLLSVPSRDDIDMPLPEGRGVVPKPGRSRPFGKGGGGARDELYEDGVACGGCCGDDGGGMRRAPRDGGGGAGSREGLQSVIMDRRKQLQEFHFAYLQGNTGADCLLMTDA